MRVCLPFRLASLLNSYATIHSEPACCCSDLTSFMSFTISDVNIATPLTTSTKEQRAVIRFAWAGGVRGVDVCRNTVTILFVHSTVRLVARKYLNIPGSMLKACQCFSIQLPSSELSSLERFFCPYVSDSGW